MTSVPLPLLWLFGPSGVGKSSVGWEVFSQLSRSGVKAGFVDGDQISLCHPVAEGSTHRIRARSLAAMWPNFRQEGAQCVILSGFVHTAEEVREYTDRLPDAAFTLCRLRVDTVELKQRFLARGWRPDLAAEAAAEAEALDRGDFADLCVDTGGLTVAEAARMVRERAGGWPRTVTAATSGDFFPNPPEPPVDAAPVAAPAFDPAPVPTSPVPAAAPTSDPAYRLTSVPSFHPVSTTTSTAASHPASTTASVLAGTPGSLPAGIPGSVPVPVLWFSGAAAVGKSTVGYEVFTQIIRAGVRTAYVDLKQIGALRPAVDDPSRHRLMARNLAAVWAGYRAAGARCLIVSGHADSDDTIRGYAELLPAAALTVCRLHAGPATLAERVARRGRGGGPVMPGDEMRGLGSAALHRIAGQAARDAEALERARAGDLRIDTDGRSVREVAARVLDLVADRPGFSSLPPFAG